MKKKPTATAHGALLNPAPTPTNPMQGEYIKLIAELDTIIEHFRKAWMEAKTPEAKVEPYNKLNELLEKRLDLMKKRDGQT